MGQIKEFSSYTPTPGYIYLIRGEDTPWFKIGTTSKLNKRIGHIGSKAPFEVTLIQAFYVSEPGREEAFWHTRFASKHVRGEWFALLDSDVREFCEDYHEDN